MGIQSKIIKKLIKIKVYKCLKDEIIIEMKCLKMLSEEHRCYQVFLEQALKKLNGVKGLDVDIVKGLITIKYDSNKQSEENVIKWAYKVKDIGIENFDLIKDQGKSNLDNVIKVIEDKLDKELKAY
ncbi:hypothetical protein [Clostridium sp.]|uniref:hypothetical protein n=1 Tax=Clostridium sp. TaxID=1506 RepID=UPI002A90E634|nr:hypothetical protein [Clostridium sp.]MDY6011376.1 hypothetical protein [Clostridium sp.]